MSKKFGAALLSFFFLINLASCSHNSNVSRDSETTSETGADTSMAEETTEADLTTAAETAGTSKNVTTALSKATQATNEETTAQPTEETAAAWTNTDSEPSAKEVSILFIGNSLTYTNDMPVILQGIARSKGKNVRVDYQSLTVGGATLSDLHSNANYGMTLFHNHWDYVVLQETGGFSSFGGETKEYYPDTFSAARAMASDIQSIKAKAIFYSPIMMGFDDAAMYYGYDGSSTPSGVFADYQKSGEQGYVDLASEIHAAVVPAGCAVANVREKYAFQVLNPSDQIHPTKASSYIIACAIYAAIFNESPEGAVDVCTSNTELSGKTSDIQALTWQSVEQFYDQNSQYPFLRLANGMNE